MRTTDLMLGDIITFKDSELDETPIPVKVIALGYQLMDGNENEALVQIGNDETCDIVTIDDDFAGYPLTPEILEKNGFVYNDLPFVQAWEQFGLALYSGGNGYRIGCGNNVALIIDSVHRLQQALRLCGIEKDIKL